MKHTFKVGKKYVLKDDPTRVCGVYECKVDGHSWDRTKRLYWTVNGKEHSLHVSRFDRYDFMVMR